MSCTKIVWRDQISSIHRETGEGYLSRPRTTNLCNRYSVSTAFTVYLGFWLHKERGSFSSVTCIYTTIQYKTKDSRHNSSKKKQKKDSRHKSRYVWCNCTSKHIVRFFFALKSCQIWCSFKTPVVLSHNSNIYCPCTDLFRKEKVHAQLETCYTR